MFSKTFYRFIFLLLALIIFGYVYNGNRPTELLTNKIKQGQNKIKIIINDGETLPQIAKNLYDSGVIRSESLFRLSLGIANIANKIQPGIYNFDKAPSLYDIVKKIATMKPDKPAISITIPEGFTNEQIIDRLLFYLPNLNREKFIALAKDKEGMLFPETYYLQSNMTEDAIINLMFNEFKSKTSFLDSSLSMAIGVSDQDRNNKLHSILVLASILEGESKNTGEEMQMIAGILNNRLKNNQKLQVDVSQYTYEHVGLPPLPINNPGLASISAAMNATSNDYVYYLHDKNGGIHYAKTYKEHLINIKKYLK